MMKNNYRRTYAEINLDHLAHNIGEIQKAFPKKSFLCPMVKADAYGHGDIEVSRTLQKMGVRQVGVCLLEEALRLREAGIHMEILVFGGFDAEGAAAILKNNLTAVVGSWDQIRDLEALPVESLSIHLKFDTGMNRLGFYTDVAEDLFQYFQTHKKIKVQALVTHLFNGEDASSTDGRSAKQLQRFHHVVKLFKPLGVFAHALNSSGLICKNNLQVSGELSLDHPLFVEDWGLRPGLMIYGHETVDENKGICLKPVMTLKACVNTLRQVKKDEVVSYGGRWQALRDSVVAILSIGYADGFHRILSNQAFVLFNGTRVPVVGTVCMDYVMVDVTDLIPPHKLTQDLALLKDSEVVLFGESQSGAVLSAGELARLAKTNSYEILTSVSARVPRIYKGTMHAPH